MNAKIAKKLRREARALTEGRPARGYVVEKQRTLKLIERKDGTLEAYEPQHGVVDPNSTRGVYLKLKRAHA